MRSDRTTAEERKIAYSNGISYITLHKRLLKGWDVQKAITEPPRQGRRQTRTFEAARLCVHCEKKIFNRNPKLKGLDLKEMRVCGSCFLELDQYKELRDLWKAITK